MSRFLEESQGPNRVACAHPCKATDVTPMFIIKIIIIVFIRL